MDQQTIDRLFREKMNGLEVDPSAQAWSEVEHRLPNKRRPSYYWIAATIALMAVSWVVFQQEPPSSTQDAVVDSTYPPRLESTVFEIPVAAKLTEKKVNEKQSAFSKHVAVTVAKTPALNESKRAVSTPTLELSPKVVVAELSTAPAMESTSPTKEIKEVQLPKEDRVKITYIASTNRSSVTEVDNATDSTSKFKRFIAFAEKIDPGEMLADIKTAKDNLLKGGFKNKKERSTMNP